MIVFAAITPHSPVSVPGIGTSSEIAALRHTLGAMERLRAELEHARPDTIVIISPHAKMEPYAFAINQEAKLKGNFADFGLEELLLEFENDFDITDKIAFSCETQEFPGHLHSSFLDHGALVPLYHLTGNMHPKLVHLSFSMLDFSKHYEYGAMLGRICEESNKRVAIIASGDLSHRLTPNAPAGYSPNAALFDRRIIGTLQHRDVQALMSLEKEMIEEAAECGLRAFIMLMGMLASRQFRFDLLAYEAPFGIGYLTARLL